MAALAGAQPAIGQFGQEPALNPSFGTGDVAPGTLLHSGEFAHTVTDLAVRGRGIDIAFTRTYRSRTVGSGPLGPGWELGYRAQLRELPNRDVEHYDGTGRREVFTWDGDRYRSPPGVFAELSRASAGWVLIDPQRTLERFDRWGRLVAIADAVKDTFDTGSEVTFRYDLRSNLVEVVDDLGRAYALAYDAAGRLVTLSDFTGRTVQYGYDSQGRLTTVTSPAVTTGESTFPSGLTTTYAYQAVPAGADLATRLNTSDNLVAITDPRGATWLELDYTDADGDGRADEVTGQTWGGHPLSIAYDFTAGTATVTNRRGHVATYEHTREGHLARLTDPAGAVWRWQYDAEGLVTLATLPLGRTVAYNYDTASDRRARGNVTSIVVTADARGPNGSSATLTTSIQYDRRTNRPVRITDPRGALTHIERDRAGLPLLITRALGAPEASITQFDYNAFGQPTRVINANGHVTEYRYATSGPAAGYLERVIVDPAGLALTTRYETDSLGRVSAVIDPRGVRREAVYNELGWLAEETTAATPAQDGSGAPALGYRSVYRFDPSGNLIERRDPIGDGTGQASTTFTYGPLGELLTTEHTVSPTGQLVREVREYDEATNLVRLTGSEGEVTEWSYDPRNLAVGVVHGMGTSEAVTEAIVRNLEGHQTEWIDGRGHSWTTAFDGYGRIAETADPLGNRRATQYDNGGQPVALRSYGAGGALLARSGAAYDLLGRRTAASAWLWQGTDPSGARELATTYTYDPVGNLLAMTDPLGRVTASSFDAAERLVMQTDPAANQQVFTYDPAGNPIRIDAIEQSPDGPVTVATSYGYDALGRRLWTEDALTNRAQTVYDARGNAVAEIDAEGYVTARSFDSLDRPLDETRPEGIRIAFGWDRASRLVSYEDALGNVTSYSCDALGRRTAVTYPDQATETYAHDDSGNLVQVIQPTGTLVQLAYDPAGRRTARTPAAGGGVFGAVADSYSHDGLGRLTGAESGNLVVTREYDSLSRPLTETIGGRTVAYSHDDAGSMTGLIYPSGLEVARGLDTLGRPTTITAGGSEVVAYLYRGQSRMAGKTLGGGAVAGRSTFDPAGRVVTSAFTGAGGAGLFGERLSWSPRGFTTARARIDLNGSGQALAYDGAVRLLAAAELPDPVATYANNTTAPLAALIDRPEVHSFSYDSAQNLLARTTAEEGIVTITALPLDASGRNRPASVNGQILAWDANGNLASKGDLRLAYDDRNRLTRVTDAAGTELARYEYDTFGRRVRKLVGGTVEETVFAFWQAVETYRDGQLAERTTYGVGLDEALRLETDPDGNGSLTPLLPLYDETGNLAVLADVSGRAVERYGFSAYGERSIAADLTLPVIEQVRSVGAELVIEVSEEVSAEALANAVAAGNFGLVETASGTPLGIDVTQSVDSGRQARRRLIVTAADPPPAAGTEVRLAIEPAALTDFFFNRPAGPFELTFPWPAVDTILHDTAAPRLVHVLVRDGILEVELSEEPDLDAATASIRVDGQALPWTLAADRYTLLASEGLGPGSHDITISTTALDLAGFGLEEAFAGSVTLTSGTESRAVYEAPDPRVVSASTLGNRLGFKGLPHDPETGLVYVRNRFYDPELGRFLTPDPLGVTDGPNLYAYALNDPINHSDPLGLQAKSGTTKVQRFYRPIYVRVEPIKSSVAWNEAEIELQLKAADRIFCEKAGVCIFWTRIKKDPDPKEALTAQGAKDLLDAAALGFSGGTGGYKGLPIFYVRETADDASEGGRAQAPRTPIDRARAAIVNRYWRGKLTNQYVTAHELGHAIGGLCDPDFTTDPLCGFGAPRPEYGGIMNYPSPYYKGVQGEGLSEGEIKRLRRNAQALATRPGGSPP